MKSLGFLSAGAICVWVAVAPAEAAAPPKTDVAIVGVTVLPMTGPDRLEDQTVITSGDHILSVGPRASTKVPAGIRVIDGRGQFLMPGLVDMHVHVAPTPGNDGDAAQRAMAVMLGYGVTTVRGMAGSPPNLMVRDKIERGEIPGPRFYAASPALNDQNTHSADEGRAAVDQAKAAGFDLIKSHELSDVATWQAIEDEAHKLGLPTAGHVNKNIGLARALTAGQEVEHLDGAIPELLPAGSPEAAADFGQVPPPEVMAVAAKATDADLDRLAGTVRAAHSFQVPTLSLFEKIADLTTPVETLASDPAMRYVPDPVLQQWAAQHEQQAEGFTTDSAAQFIALRRRIVAAYRRAGVPLMTGSDTAQGFHLWGVAEQAEVRSLAKAGLTPVEALRAATVVPRDYFRSLPNGGSALGWKAEFGTVTPGARADLILLAADPSRDVANLARPNLVIAGGRVYDRPTLDALLAKASADAKAQQPGAPPPPAASGPRATRVATIDGKATPLGPCDVKGLAPDALCGTIMVPENRALRNGRRIPIRFAVLPAIGNPTKDPLVSIPGGPGLGGVQGGQGMDQLFGPMRQNRDLVLIDQRGTGASNPLNCPEADDSNPLADFEGQKASDVIACRKALEAKADLHFYHTREAVKDMDLVRTALGHDRFDLFGMSYGSRVALDYLREFPNRVGHVVIRAAAPVGMDLPLWTPRDTQHSFDRLVVACNSQAACKSRYPYLAGDMKSILARLDQAPAAVRVRNPVNGKLIEGKLGRNGFGQVMFSMLYIPEFYSQLPPLLDRAKDGDFSPIVQAAAPFLFGVGGEIAWGMYRSVVCDEDVNRIRASQIAPATRGTLMGRSGVDDEVMACRNWVRSPVPADFLRPVKSDRPVLIISGEFDPVAGKVWGDFAARTLPNSLHIEVPGASHLPPLPGCTTQLMTEYLDGKPLKALDTSCVSKSAPSRLRVGAAPPR